jgi:hypothetical protein
MYKTIELLLSRMRADLDQLTAQDDARRFFHATYLRTTEAVAAGIDSGMFLDPVWLRAWDLAFASLYIRALEEDSAGGPVPQPWRLAFDTARNRTDLPPVRHVLLGINAHINYDLPQALLAVMSSGDFDDPDVMRRREADHHRLDDILSARVAAEDAELSALSRTTLLDRLLRPLNQLGTKRFLAEARQKVWRNAIALDRARRAGQSEYVRTLAELERLCAARLADLRAPGPVLLRLAVRGFGVVLPARQS